MLEILTKNVKKIARWGEGGYAVFITKEAKQFGWSDKNHVVITAVREGKDERIEIRKLDI